MSNKKKVKKKSRKKVGTQEKKYFEVFAKGVERLKELELELNSLDTAGFNREEQSIRAKLKSVSEIPSIERELKILKQKIKGRHKVSRKANYPIKKDLVEIKKKIPGIERGIKKIEELKGEFPPIKSGIKKLNEDIEKLSEKKRVLVDPNVDLLVEDDFNEFLGDIKSKISLRLKSKKKQMEDVLKEDLKDREERFREKYVSLVREFNDKKKRLEQDISKKYKQKVESDLKREISEKFNDQLKKKLDDEKTILGKKYHQELEKQAHKHLENEKIRLRNHLNKEYSMKLNALREKERMEVAKIRESENEKIKKIRSEENQKVAAAENKNKFQIGSELARIKSEREKLESLDRNYRTDLNKKLQEKLKMVKEEEERKLIVLENQKKLEMNSELARIRGQREKLELEETKYKDIMDEKYKQKLNELKKQEELEKTQIMNSRNKLNQEKIKIRQQISDEFHKKLDEELAKREKLIREQLRAEFNLNLNKKIQEHEEELKKKKLQLQLNLQNKMKQMLD